MAKSQSNGQVKRSKKCGIVMPITTSPDYPEDHWKDVLSILMEAINETEFEPRLVSDDVAIGLIHDRIVTNIYNDDIIVCDVSSKNPNVMFELGMRLAFDKPTIIIKDEKTGYSFDTGVIEHISYPSSLRFSEIVDFKIELAKRINATFERATSETNYSPFLKSFGKTIVPASIQETEVPEGKYIMEQLEMLRHELRSMRIERKNEDLTSKSKRFIVSENLKKSLLKDIITRHLNANEILSEKELLSIIRNQSLKNGFDLSDREIQEFISEYSSNNKMQKK